MSTLFIISTSLYLFSYVIPSVIKYIVGWFFSEPKGEQNLRSEMIKLEQEMSSISMVDEFSRYTKVQRKHTKLREDFKNLVSVRMSARAKAVLFFTYSARVFNGLVILIMLKLYRTEPVVIFPKGILWPLDKILSWPSTYEDSISLAMWTGLLTIVSRTT
ncbi:tail-anchored protein insertion receptor WRB [Fopius arisanus]|uniref:Guided entry of tail-anchored proteins factor 1 n=1 Tax=Fopius arisanus TaxID=64838 RepID=A0A9R1TKK9_9HYME|nr:PREDICTED: tail-anchored protein insertion receptor WRB-like [Fopius arisanus]